MHRGEMLARTQASTNYDADLYQKSLERITKIDIEKIICYHGGLYLVKDNQRIATLTA